MPSCFKCGVLLQKQESIAQNFKSKGWIILPDSKQGTGIDSPLWVGVFCNKCIKIFCHQCTGFRPDTHPAGPCYDVKCPKCNGKVIPLNDDILKKYFKI